MLQVEPPSSALRASSVKQRSVAATSSSYERSSDSDHSPRIASVKKVLLGVRNHPSSWYTEYKQYVVGRSYFKSSSWTQLNLTNANASASSFL